MNNEFKVGDFVMVGNSVYANQGNGQVHRLIYKIAGNIVFVIILNSDCNTASQNINFYSKIIPSNEDIRMSKLLIEKCFRLKEFDNLTYVELLAELKNYE